ncbi:MAG: hypothetical protein KGL39_23245 [Patescibacteria group bacterium]|nr:hypothetical protein [Patescibacteria group bacterium]
MPKRMSGEPDKKKVLIILTEKLSALVDFIASAFYNSRSDFTREALRKACVEHAQELERLTRVTPTPLLTGEEVGQLRELLETAEKELDVAEVTEEQ